MIQDVVTRLVGWLGSGWKRVAGVEALCALADDGEVNSCLQTDISDAPLEKYRSAILKTYPKTVDLLESENSDMRAAGVKLLSKLSAYGWFPTAS